MNLTYRFLSYSFPHLDNVCPESLFYVICVVKKRVGEGAEKALLCYGNGFLRVRKGLYGSVIKPVS